MKMYLPLAKFFRVTKNLLRNLYFLMFLNGFMIASILYFKMQSSYETGLFSSIKAAIDNKIDADDTNDSIVVKAMNACNYLMTNRATIFGNTTNSLGIQADLLHPTSVDLMTARGACGSYSQVLARILYSYHYPIRIAQMRANGVWAAHNLVEVNTGVRWVILDPTFNTCFVRPDAHLASFDDVKNDWPYYARQVPANYDLQYRYEDVRYSNWTKVPILFPAIKKTLDLTLGRQRADTISTRTWFLRVYDTWYFLALLAYLPICLFTIRRLIQTRVFPDPAIPFTFRNLMKYIGSVNTGNETGISQ